jgi:hypothetical protein
LDTRPALTSALTEDEFRAWYWLKDELIAFCRSAHLPYAGNKQDIERVICAHLSGAIYRSNQAPRRAKGAMPAVFSLDDRIGEGWTCNPALGAFFRAHAGRGFRFNKAMRDFIHTEVGKTLADALACYRHSIASNQPKREIAPSLEYNRHTRAFYEAHPGTSRADVIAAWWETRGRRKA